METYQLEEKPPTKAPIENEAPPSPLQKYKTIFLIVGVLLGFLVMFLLGVVVSSSGKKEVTVLPTPTPAPEVMVTGTLSPSPGSQPNSPVAYLPNKEYFDDSIAIIAKNDPHRALMVSVARSEQQKNYAQYSKVQYYNGTAWLRENVTSTIPRSGIINNPLIRRWSIATTVANTFSNDSRVEVTISNTPVTFTVKKISYDIAAKTYPGYTKFNYFGEGILKTPEDDEEAYFIYTQTYAINAADLSFLGTPGKLDGDWIAFWDQQGTAYLVDVLTSDQGGKPYQNYQYASVLTSDAKSQKFSQVTVQKATQRNQYSTTVSTEPQSSLSFLLSNPVEKATDKSYTWQSGVITGTVNHEDQGINGFGLMESIHKKR